MPTLTDQIIAAIGPARTASDMAQATYEALCQAALVEGMTPQEEVYLRIPGDDRNHGNPACFWVAWESGPNNWATGISGLLSEVTGRVVSAPQSFSLQFDPRGD